jgi:hypothetical protein
VIGSLNSDLRALFRAIVAGDAAQASQLVKRSPQLASETARAASSYARAIGHYIYGGDTPLHVAAAAYRHDIAKTLISSGADIGARNRRGAEPLHYACDGQPGSARWNPGAQTATLEYLLRAGADPNATDKSGVAPLHRAVRTRCAAAVSVLLAHGADPRLKNGSGSTPLHLAVQTTGRGGSGTASAREQQARIIRVLLAHGARPIDTDDRGKTVTQSITAGWVKQLVETR